MDISNLLERAAGRLMEDESLRSNLDDEQAKTVLDHILRWLEGRLSQVEPSSLPASSEQEIARAIKAMRAINTMMASPQPPILQEALEKLLPLAARPGPTPGGRPASLQKASLLRRVLKRLQSVWRRATAGDQPKP